MKIDLTNTHPCPDCRQCLTNADKCRYCTERDQLRAEVERLRVVVEYESGFRKLADEETARAEAAETQLQTASNNARHYAAKREELEAHVADLRGALEGLIADAECIRHWHDAGKNGEGMIVSNAKVHELWAETDKARVARNRTPAQSLDQLKAKVLRGAAEGLINMATTVERNRSYPCGWEACVNRLLEIADQLDRQAEADRLEKGAANDPH